MKTINSIIRITSIASILLFSQFANAQKISQKSVAVTVSGTSPLHDWDMTSAAATFTGTVSGNSIANATFSIPAKNLKSKKGKMMDNKAYDALKATANPTITFSAATIPVGKSNVAGKLTIAGVSKNVSIPVTVVKKGNTFAINGTENLKLSEYGMERPGFMGVKTGDAISVNVKIVAE